MATIQHKVSYTRANPETPFFHAYEGKSTDMSALATHIKTNFEDTAKNNQYQFRISKCNFTKITSMSKQSAQFDNLFEEERIAI